MNIRRATSQDAQALTALVFASKRSNGYDDAFMAACVDELAVTSDDIAQTLYWVAEDTQVMGCVSLDVQGTTGKISAFFVAPDHKRKGVGRALWQVLRKAAQDAGLSELVLDSDPQAVPFYTALGFTTIRQTPSGSIPGRMLPHMQLVL